MKCIGKPCPHFQEHMFNDSWFVCGLTEVSAIKNKLCTCYIDSEIDSMQEQLDKERTVEEFIKSKQ